MHYVFLTAGFAQRTRKPRDRLLELLFVVDWVAASGLTIYLWYARPPDACLDAHD